MAHKGDQFYLELILKVNGEPTDGEGYDDIRVQIGDKLFSVSDGTLTYDAENEVWTVFMSELDTWKAKSNTLVQAGYKLGNTWVYTDMTRADFNYSIIKESWSE